MNFGSAERTSLYVLATPKYLAMLSLRLVSRKDSSMRFVEIFSSFTSKVCLTSLRRLKSELKL